MCIHMHALLMLRFQGSPQKSVKAYGTSHELIYLFQPAFTMDKPTILREHGRILCALHAHDLF